jgi:endonuclease/exonuclease/phosphatase family metal-dependent hydrolase
VDYARLREYARGLNADIVALQEVNGPEAAARVFDPEEYAFHFPQRPQVQSTGFAYRRSLNVTVLPDVTSLALEHLRPGVDLVVRVDGRELRLLAIHLKAGCPRGDLQRPSRSCTKLRRQLVELERWVDARAEEETPFVVLGDFNRRLAGTDALWAEIDDGEPHNAVLNAPARHQRSACWGESPRHFIDHIVLDRLASTWIQPGSFREVMYAPSDAAYKRTLSDHCPVSITLKAPER